MPGTPASLRRFHQRLVLERVLRAGPASRADLAKVTGLSAPTVGKVADDLLAAGVLEEGEPSLAMGGNGAAGREPVLGRPGRALRLSRAAPRFVAVQLGVRHTRVAALPVAGPEFAAQTGTRTQAGAWPVQFLTPRSPAAWRRQLQTAARTLRVGEPWAVVASVPGVVDETAGRVLLSPNLHWTEKGCLPEVLRGIWPAPVCLVQEIRALALGQLAAEPECRDFLLVDFGQGVGGALVAGGRLYEAALALSCELGHTPVRGNPRLCGCGAVGCMETLASRPGLLASFAAAHRRAPRTWRALVQHVRAHGLEAWLFEALDAAAVAIAGALNVLGVRQVIVTGAVTELPDAAMEHLAGAVERAAMWARFGQVLCRPAPRRWAAGLIAAAIDRVLLPGGAWEAWAAGGMVPGMPGIRGHRRIGG